MSKPLDQLIRLPLQRRLMLGFGSLLVLSVALGVQSLRTQEQLHRDSDRLYASETLGMARAKEAQIQLLRLDMGLNQVLRADSPGTRDAAVQQLEEARKQLRSTLARLRPTLIR